MKLILTEDEYNKQLAKASLLTFKQYRQIFRLITGNIGLRLRFIQQVNEYFIYEGLNSHDIYHSQYDLKNSKLHEVQL